MAPIESAAVVRADTSKLDSAQTLRASVALLRKIQPAQTSRESNTDKLSLLADADEQDAEDETPVWLVLTTKKHIVDKKRLKPGKISLPHPYLDVNDEKLRICLITADPQRKYKDLLDDPGFPAELRKSVTRVVGLEKLKARYKSFESKRQLLGEYDVFLADDRIITHLPRVLGKIFYKGGNKRPIPVSLEGKRQSVDEQGNKRQKLSEGGTKVVRNAVRPQDVAHEIKRAVSSALVHLAPSTTTAVKVGQASMEPAHLQKNVETVTEVLVEKYVPQQWRNVKSVHIKGPNTIALPIYMAEELWTDEHDILDKPLPVKEKSKKRKRGALADAAGGEPTVIEVPGPDGKMRRLEAPSAKRKSEVADEAAAAVAEKAEKALRADAIRKQKADAKNAVIADTMTKKATTAKGDGKKASKKTTVKAAEMK